MLEATSHGKLKDILKKHGGYISDHKENLKWIADKMGFSVEGETCHAMSGLIKETKAFLEEDAESHVRDAGIIADVQRIAHYFITGYGTISTWADEMNLDGGVQKRCKTGVDNAEKIDKMLKDLAKSRVNEEAVH